jgi:glycerophosphoryl diester phosphodiesterase
MGTLVISHIACGGHAPENSMSGILKAIELGADGIEIDVQASADGVPVLMHDLTVDRTTNGTGAVASLTLEQLRALDAGGETIPTLAEALAETRGKVLLVMEIKQPGIEAQVAKVVHEQGAIGEVMAWSFFPEALDGMRKAEPRIPCALLVSPEAVDKWPKIKESAVRMGLQGVSLFFSAVNEKTVRECLLSGLSVYTWTPDAQEEIERLVRLGIDGICTNYPERAVAAIKG